MRIVTVPLLIAPLLCLAGAAMAADPFNFGGKPDVEIIGYVVDTKAVVRAGVHQHLVAAGQGWAAIKLKVTQEMTGHVKSKAIYVSHVAITSMPELTWHCTEGEWYRLRLRLDADLSKWCEMDVYDVVGGQQVPVQRPNQSSDPTPTPVTPPAGQEARHP